MNFCALDIETVPNFDLSPQCIPEPKSPAKNLTDPIKIEKAKEEAEQARIKQMSLDPDLCRVVCVGVYFDKAEARITDEKTLLHDTWNFIEIAYFNHIPLITFNGIQFDLPVLWHSAIRLGIPIDPRMYKDLTKKYDNRYHYDLFPILCDWDKQRYKGRGLEYWATLYGLGEKVGDGSEIYGFWQAKEYEKIRQHCEADVNITVKLWEKIEPYVREREE